MQEVACLQLDWQILYRRPVSTAGSGQAWIPRAIERERSSISLPVHFRHLLSGVTRS